MASSSSVSSRNWTYNVFASFRGPDVRKTLLSHMREQFNRNGITMFDDQGIERSAMIAPSLIQGIKESRIAILILSKKYASSRWCLDELLEILECQKAIGQIVMTIFYGVEASNVRNQTGEFGIAFSETCALKTNKEKKKWSKALEYVGNIAGEDFKNWDNEANMIKKLAKDISEKLHATPSRDFDDMVGLEAHLKEVECLLDLNYDGVKIVAISGPAGIGKTTIARALQSQLSHRFQLTCFVDNLRGSYHHSDEYCLKLGLQEQFLSKILKLDGIKISHLGVIEERLCKQRVLIVLDDVTHIKQLEALANETTWFGPGSRIVITTENKELLQQHGIYHTYNVPFPSNQQALKILCRYAFRKNSLYHGFEKLLLRVTELCDNLPLGLCVVGSSLRGKTVDEWEGVVGRLDTILNREIEDVLRVGYDSLDEKEQSLFLHIAVLFNYNNCDLVKAMFRDSDVDVKHGLKILVNRSLIKISEFNQSIVIHKLLQRVGKKAIHNQEPWKRQILIHAREICDVLDHASGTRAVSGISFDISGLDELSISQEAFKKMPNLRFLKVYKSKEDGNDVVHLPAEMEFPRRLRLLQWEAYPNKCLPPRLHMEYLVKLDMRNSKLEYLWQGTQPLTNLKEIDLRGSYQLKELPDLTHATNLEKLNLSLCKSLVEIPSSFSHLQKLQKLIMMDCTNLQVIPAHLNLASLDEVYMRGCSKLRNFPVLSTNVTYLCICGTVVEDLPASIRLCSRLQYLDLSENGKLKGLTHFPTSLVTLILSYTDIERIPDSIKALCGLERLYVSGCSKLTALPELPGSLECLWANDCESLETVFCPFYSADVMLDFTNCFKLDQQARRDILQQPNSSGRISLPGRDMPADFDHRARGNSLTICMDDNMPLHVRFQVCLVISPYNHIKDFNYKTVVGRRIVNGKVEPFDEVRIIDHNGICRTEHLFTFISTWRYFHSGEVNSEIMFEFSSRFGDFQVTECGAKITTEEIFQENDYEPLKDDTDCAQEVICDTKEDDDLEEEESTDGWSWLILCSHFVKNIGSLISGRR